MGSGVRIGANRNGPMFGACMVALRLCRDGVRDIDTAGCDGAPLAACRNEQPWLRERGILSKLRSNKDRFNRGWVWTHGASHRAYASVGV